jgi:hypothetical protein
VQKTGKIELEKLNMLRNDLYVGKRTVSILDRILRRIVENPGINAYQIARISPRLDRITVMRHVRRFRLVGERYVRVEKGKRNAICYFITLKGILLVLQRELSRTDTEKWNYDYKQLLRGYNKIHEIIRKNESLLPLVFGKWDYFRMFHVEKSVLFRLAKAVYRQNHLGFYGITGGAIEKNIVRRIYNIFFFSGTWLPETLEFDGFKLPYEDINYWTAMWKGDPEIKAYITKELKEYQKSVRTANISIAYVIKVIEDENIEGLGDRS